MEHGACEVQAKMQQLRAAGVRSRWPVSAAPLKHTPYLLCSCIACAEFNAFTTHAEVQGTVPAAIAALRVPRVEHVTLPQFVAGLKARIGGGLCLDPMASDATSQQRLCAMMPNSNSAASSP
jgi:hypothetical protein